MLNEEGVLSANRSASMRSFSFLLISLELVFSGAKGAMAEVPGTIPATGSNAALGFAGGTGVTGAMGLDGGTVGLGCGSNWASFLRISSRAFAISLESGTVTGVAAKTGAGAGTGVGLETTGGGASAGAGAATTGGGVGSAASFCCV